MFRIILDMDEVLIDFNKPAHKLLGIPSVPWPWPVGQFNLECYDEEFWANLTLEWWRTRSWTHFGKELIDLCKAYVGLENMWLATTMIEPCDLRDVIGKLFWIREECPELLDRLIFCTDKRIMGSTKSVLIDDYQKNIDEFRLAGGYGILVPACHNHMHRSDPIKHVRRGLQNLIKKGYVQC